MSDGDKKTSFAWVDGMVGNLPEGVRHTLILVAFIGVGVSGGVVAGRWDVSAEIQLIRDENRESAIARLELVRAIEAGESERRELRAGLAEIRLQITRADLENMAERVRRMDRELCLLPHTLAGTVTTALQQECSRR